MSDRDIREILRERISQTPSEVEKNGTPDLKGWKPAWTNLSLEKQYEESRKSASIRSESPRAETTISKTSTTSLPKAAGNPKGCFPNEIDNRVSTATPIVEQETNQINETSDQPQSRGNVEQSDQSRVAEASRDLLKDSPLPRTEIRTDGVGNDDVRLPVNFVPVKSPATVSPSTAMAACFKSEDSNMNIVLSMPQLSG